MVMKNTMGLILKRHLIERIPTIRVYVTDTWVQIRGSGEWSLFTDTEKEKLKEFGLTPRTNCIQLDADGQKDLVWKLLGIKE